MSAFEGGCRKALTALLFFAVLTAWRADRWCDFAFEAGVLALAAVWLAARAGSGGTVAGSVALVPLAGAVVVGCAQLVAGTTVYRFETRVAVLEWSAYLAVCFLAVQLYGEPGARVGLRRAMLYFGFVVSVVSVVQMFTSGGKVFWVFPTAYKDFVVGPFINRDHYSCFIELVLPVAVVEAFASRRRRVASAVMAGAMFASVIAGASRAGAAIVTLEVAVVSLAAVREGGAGMRTRLGTFARVAALAAVFTGVVGWEILWQRFQEADPYKFRREVVMGTLEMVRARPGMGFGLGTFEVAYPGYAIIDSGMTVNHAHNDWAEWAAVGGLPLLGLMLLAAGWSMRAAWRSPWAVGVVAVFAHSLVDYPLHTVAIAAWLFAVMGAAAGAARAQPLAVSLPAGSSWQKRA